MLPYERDNEIFDTIIVVKNETTLLTKSDAAIFVMSSSTKLFFS